MYQIDDAFQCALKAIQVCLLATATERQQPLGTRLTGVVLDEVEHNCLASLNHWSDISPVMQTLHRADISAQPVAAFGGARCGKCGKTTRQGGVNSFDYCGRCHLTAFCSEACLAAAWPEHKKVCRKPGEFKAGDVVFSKDDDGTNPLKVVAKSPDGEGDMILTGKVFPRVHILAKTKDLRRCRPEMWELAWGNDPAGKLSSDL